MPAWLSPRVRLGVIVSVVLIVCAFLLTPAGYDRHDLPSSFAPSPGTIASKAITPPLTHTPPVRALPQLVIKELSLASSETFSGSLSSLTTDVAPFTPDPETWSRLESSPDVYGDMMLAHRGILLDWPGCLDCGRSSGPRPGIAPLGVLHGSAGGGGGGAAGTGGGTGSGVEGGPRLGDAAALVELTELGNRSRDVTDDGKVERPSDGHSTRPDGYSTREVSGGRGNRPGSVPPGVVSVPEPSTFMLLSTAVLSMMIGANRARKRRR